MGNRYKPFFKENIQTQKELELLADLIIRESVYRSIPIIKNNIKKAEENFKKNNEEFTLKNFESIIWIPFYPVLLRSIEYVKIPKELKAFVKDKGILRVEFTSKYSSRRGDYSDKNINIYLDNDILEKARNIIVDAYVTVNFPLEHYASRLISLLMKGNTEHILIHELQHFYDDWRSKGEYQKSNYTNDPESDLYWSNPLEISARYSQAIAILKQKKTLSGSLKSVIYEFKKEFRAWDKISKEEQKRLLSRLSQEYQEYNKSFNVPLIDITNIVERFNKNHDKDIVELYYRGKDYNYIEIHKLKTGDIRQDEILLKEIIKLSEIYRYILTCSIDKFYITNPVQTVNLLKQYDFKANIGSKRNYAFTTSKYYYVRYPKRK
jgi:hypothetical protein